jgi:methionyl aminopeptidase
MIILKTAHEIEMMKKAGALLGSAFDFIAPTLVPGVSTWQVNKEFEKYVESHGGVMAEKGYEGFPGSICASVNEVLIHGIPSKKVILKEGDIVSLDVVVSKNGYMADACRTYAIGNVSSEAKRVIQCAEEAFWLAFSRVKEGVRIRECSRAISETARKYGCSTLKEYGGHGIGKDMHEDPFVPNYAGEEGYDDYFINPVIHKGLCFCVEPMILAGSDKIRNLADGWGVAAADGRLTAHYENTIAVCDDGTPIVTTVDSNVKGHLTNVER